MLNSTGAYLVASTYLGGVDWDETWGMALTDPGKVAVTGVTHSHNYPTTDSAYDPIWNGGDDALVTTLSFATEFAHLPENVPVVAGAGLEIFPHPAIPGTEVRFSLRRAGWVELELFDVAGRRVADLLRDWLPEGEHRIDWSERTLHGGRVSPGVYLLRLATSSGSQSARILITR